MYTIIVIMVWLWVYKMIKLSKITSDVNKNKQKTQPNQTTANKTKHNKQKNTQELRHWRDLQTQTCLKKQTNKNKTEVFCSL